MPRNVDAIIRNEFAVVSVRADVTAHGERLRIEDMATGNVIFLDALELEALTRASHEFLRPLLPLGSIVPPEDHR
jgi:hypothetical protein